MSESWHLCLYHLSELFMEDFNLGYGAHGFQSRINWIYKPFWIILGLWCWFSRAIGWQKPQILQTNFKVSIVWARLSCPSFIQLTLALERKSHLPLDVSQTSSPDRSLEYYTFFIYSQQFIIIAFLNSESNASSTGYCWNPSPEMVFGFWDTNSCHAVPTDVWLEI